MKEKVILGNKVELPYDSIGFGAGTLAISFKAGDIAALENPSATLARTIWK